MNIVVNLKDIIGLILFSIAIGIWGISKGLVWLEDYFKK